MNSKTTNQFHAENGMPVKPTIVPRYNVDEENKNIKIYLDKSFVKDFSIKKIVQQEGDATIVLNDVHIVLTNLDDEVSNKINTYKYEFCDK